MQTDKRKWFDTPDSEVEHEDGKHVYCNVEGRFSDHAVLNPEMTRVQRHNVYDIGIVLHTRVKRAGGDAAAQKNMSALTLNFNNEEDFKAAKAAIQRNSAAWEHYQKYREAPQTDNERKCLEQIKMEPEKPKGVLVAVGDDLVRKNFDVDADLDDEQEQAELKAARDRMTPKPKRHAKKTLA